MGFLSFLMKPKPVSDPLVSEYASLCEEASQVLATAGVHVLPYLDQSFERFRSHSHPQRVVEVLRTYTDVLKEAQEAGEPLGDNKRILWRMISRLGLTPRSDLLDSLRDDDTIEIYTFDNWQIFRNLTYFNYVDTTIDELSVFVWTRDTKRNLRITQEGMRLVFLLKTGLMKQTFHISTMPPHKVEFYASGKTQKIEVALRMASPLRKGRSLEAFVVTNKTKALAPETPVEF